MKKESESLMGPLEKIFFEKLMEKDGGVDYTDFIGTGITLENIDEVAKNFNRAFLLESPDADGLQVTYYPPVQ